MRPILTLLLLLILACSNNQTPFTASNSSEPGINPKAENPEIKIHVAGMSSGLAQLIGTFGDQQFRMDTATINQNGDETLLLR